MLLSLYNDVKSNNSRSKRSHFMITAVVGKPGSGKSMYLVGLARSEMKAGRDVYSNIVIDENKFKLKGKKIGKLFYYQTLEQLTYVKDGTVLLDEVGAYLDSRQYTNFPTDVRIKFQQHRKDGLNMFYSVQSYGRADLIIRQLTNDILVCKNLWGLFFTLTRYDADEYEEEKPKMLGFKFFIPNRKVFKAYDTLQSINRQMVENYKFIRMADYIKEILQRSTNGSTSKKLVQSTS